MSMPSIMLYHSCCCGGACGQWSSYAHCCLWKVVIVSGVTISTWLCYSGPNFVDMSAAFSSMQKIGQSVKGNIGKWPVDALHFWKLKHTNPGQW